MDTLSLYNLWRKAFGGGNIKEATEHYSHLEARWRETGSAGGQGFEEWLHALAYQTCAPTPKPFIKTLGTEGVSAACKTHAPLRDIAKASVERVGANAVIILGIVAGVAGIGYIANRYLSDSRPWARKIAAPDGSRAEILGPRP